jgi:hypothetical protein
MMWWTKKTKLEKTREKIQYLQASLFVEQLKLTYYTDLDMLKKKLNV